MKKLQIVRAFIFGVHTVIFSLFITTIFFPETGALAIFKEVMIALFALTCASIFAFAFVPLVKAKRYGKAVLVAVIALAVTWYGSAQTVNVVKDLSLGEQKFVLSRCSIVANNDKMIIPSEYELRGYDTAGTFRAFPITEGEYNAMSRASETAGDTWRVDAVGYLNSKRIVTFTAEVESEEVNEDVS